ncbi:unnamed protein product [Somion occarium]|uniref:lytic cellulose monooxygenase (C4-dehydrogenating) n=1 Tax=Somion occarium TaxID=3059160 RepID=A0ABP1CN47_9APHY
MGNGPSPIRLVNDIGPVKGSSNDDLMCGLSAQKAAMVVPANPGSKVTFQWSGGGGQKWPHNTGPLMTYMASCGSTSCGQFDPSGAQWFKIDEVGRKSDGNWYQMDISKGASFDVSLPQDLAPGGYLIRHEILALHLAVSMGGAEFYPSCTQVQIGGNGSGKPNATVSFPGAYSDSDPGIYDPTYTFPGGPVSNLAATSDSLGAPASGSASFPSGTAAPSPSPSGGSGSGSGSSSSGGNGGSSSSATSPTSASSSSSGGSQGGGSCSLKRKKSSPGNNNHPRHYSRIMKRIMHHATAVSSF